LLHTEHLVYRVNAIRLRKRPFRPPLDRLRRYRSGFARNRGCHHINISADVGRASQRCGFIEQPINSGLFELPPWFALFASTWNWC
jgi:hypothetical protein